MRVVGTGSLTPKGGLMIVGEGPGWMESATGIPFHPQAPAGAELTRYLNGVTLPTRDEVWITNLVKAWEGGASTKKQDVKPEDIARDEWELHIELQEVQPKIVAALGRHSTRWLLGMIDVDMEAVHGLLFEIEYCPDCLNRYSFLMGVVALAADGAGGPCTHPHVQSLYVLPVYHPAAGLHRPEMAARTAYDFAQLSAVLKTPTVLLPKRCWVPKPDGHYWRWQPGMFSHDPGEEQGIDTEGTPEEPYCLSISPKPGHAEVKRFADCNGSPALVTENLPEVRWIFHYYPYDQKVLAAKGIEIPEDRFDDTNLMAYLLGVEPQGLKALSLRHLGRLRPSFEQVFGVEIEVLGKSGKVLKKKKKALVGFDDVPEQIMTDYAGSDADDTLSLKPILWKKCQDLGLEQVYEIDRRVLPLYSRMEVVGLPIDLEAYFKEVEKVTEDLEDATALLSAQAFQLAPVSCQDFNPASPDQIAHLLFNVLHLPGHKKTPSGKRLSTNDKYLQALRHEHPIVQQIIDWRELAKHKNTFIDPLLAHVRGGVDGHPRLFFSLSPYRVVSGRVAYKDPNVGALPKHSDLGKRFRKIVRAPAGHTLVEWDLSQVELRVLALDAQSETLRSLFEAGADNHAETASAIFGGPADQPQYKKGPKRVAAKGVNFGIPMGITKYGLAEQMRKHGYPFPELQGTTFVSYKHRLEAEAEVCDQWIKRVIAHWGIAPYISECHAMARRFGYIQDRWGRKRFLPSVLSPNKMVREEALRQAQAFGPQAGARGFMKQIEYRVWRQVIRKMQPYGFCEALLDGHDALLIEVDEGCADFVFMCLSEAFNGTFKDLPIPITAEGAMGQTWAEAGGQ